MKYFIVLCFFYTTVIGASLQQLDGRIVGGEETTIEEFPYQASVRYYDQHLCGGSIIDENTILTSAHCIYGMQQMWFSVRVGGTIHSQGESHDIKNITINQGYDPATIDNDTAILKLKNPLTYSSRVQPIELQAQGVEIPAGTTAWVSGWGTTYEGSQITPDVLRRVDVRIIPKQDCIDRYGPGTISSHMLCAQTFGHDTCLGDTGGPLVAYGKLIGVVSWGYGCARPAYPGVYAKVSDLHNWIQNHR